MGKILISIFFVSLLFTSPIYGKPKIKAHGVGLKTCVWVLEHKNDSVASLIIKSYIQGYISGVNQMNFFEGNIPQIELDTDELYRLAMQKCRDSPEYHFFIAMAHVVLDELNSKKK